MGNSDKSVIVYHATPLCRKCHDEISKVKNASSRVGAEMLVKYSLWKRMKYGLKLMSMPVVVVDGRPFSVLGAFSSESLTAELKRKGQVH